MHSRNCGYMGRAMYRRLQVLLFCFFGLLLLPDVSAQSTTTRELYVKPTMDTSCPEPCHTLDEYVQNATQYFVSNTTFNFLPGNHGLSQSLNVSGVTNLAIVAINGTVNITCQYNLSVYFTEIYNLTLESLTLDSCGTLVLTDLLHLDLLEISVKPLYVKSYSVPEVFYDILSATNILGKSSIVGLRIIPPAYKSIFAILQLEISYSNNSAWPLPSCNELTINDSSLLFPQCGEIRTSFEFEQSTYGVNLLLNNLTVASYLQIYIRSAAPNNITLINLRSVNIAPVSPPSSAIEVQDASLSNTSVLVENCSFSSLRIVFVLTSAQVTIVNTFIANVGELSVVAHNDMHKPFVVNNVTFATSVGTEVLFLSNVTNMAIIECKFLDTVNIDLFTAQQAVVWMENCSNVSFTNCEFSNNSATPIAAFDSTFILSGSNNFTNNIAPEGSAMAFYGQSYVTLVNGSDILFVNNSAEMVGGAIYVDYELKSPCFFILDGQYDCNNTVNPPTPVTMRFENNAAENGGSAVYGALLDTCQVVNSMECHGWNFVNSLFHIDQRNGSLLSAITSEPIRVCLCDADGKPTCGRIISNLAVFPGEPFSVSAVVVGDRFGTVDGSVYAQLLPLYGPYVAELGNLEWSQRVRHFKCANLSYTVLSNNSTSVDVSLILTTSSTRVHHYPIWEMINETEAKAAIYDRTGYIDSLLRSFPVFVNITLLPCPLGFILSGEPYQCICDPRLQKNNIPCNLTTQTVQRSGTEWVNASFHNSTYNGVIVNKYCPNNYCKCEALNVSLEHPDSQCAFNHSGILCGGCQSGLSLALGSHQCLSCLNDYPTLLLLFALAGVALVFFLKLLNLTVANGSLNGLIFYANIVRANQVAWIPANHTNILTIFIAWLNLDLGIQTCFIDGLDAYWYTWLQFVFPLYVWAIAILIIVLSCYSSTAAKIFGRNSVPVLATLFLLSYSKLFRTSIFIFHASTLDYPNGTSAIVWSYDGNVPYFSAKRIPLLLVALMVVLFLWLPYTGVLLFGQCLLSSNYRVARLLLKLKPFLDAYFGPLKNKHRYWVGLLLLVRGALFVVYAATPTSMAGIDLLATGIAILCLLVYRNAGYVYRKTHLNLLQSTFFLNIGVLAMGTFYIQVSGGNQAALAYTSVGIAFAVFVTLVVFHAFLASLPAIRWINGLANRYFHGRQRNSQQLNQARGQYIYDHVSDESDRTTESEVIRVSFSQYREPILQYLDNQ